MSKQPAKLRLISGVGAKGPACFLLEAAGKRLMLDLGEGPPPGHLPNIHGVGPIDALVLSHGHKDHVGGLAMLRELGNPPIYATEIVGSGLPDGHDVKPLPVIGTGAVLGIEVKCGRNGHAPGGIWLHFAVGGGFLYTGDWSAESILYAYDAPPPAAVALVDCSYAAYDKTIAECWHSLSAHAAQRALLLPVPANGRGPEIALAFARHGFGEIFIDEAMRKALRLLCTGAAISLRPGVRSEIERLVETARPIAAPHGIMLAASADGSSGSAARLISDWQGAPEPAIVFTGYITPATPAERLINNGRAQFVRWNVHPRLRDLVALARDIAAQTLIPAFCDRAHLPELAKALAPVHIAMPESIAF
jgi:Cft2 family RNA processing exonuclease